MSTITKSSISGSIADDFCRGKLPSLKLDNNSFLKIEGGKVSVRGSDYNRVEVFYAADLDIPYWSKNGALVSSIMTEGRGRTTPGGKPKRPFCGTCNLNWPI